MKGYLTISKFARLANTTVETLKHYNSIGLLKPEHIDSDNGYRYYSISQLYELQLIKYLRSLNISIGNIQEYMRNQNIDTTVSMIQRELQSINKEITQINFRKRALETRLSYLKQAQYAAINLESITLNKFRARYVVSTGRIFENATVESEEAFMELCNIFDDDLPVFFLRQFGNVIPKEQLLNPKTDKHSIYFAFIEKAEASRYPTYSSTIDEGYFICGYFKGSYHARSNLLKKMLTFIEKRNYVIAGDAIQIKLCDEAETLDPRDFIHQIQIPVTL